MGMPVCLLFQLRWAVCHYSMCLASRIDADIDGAGESDGTAGAGDPHIATGRGGVEGERLSRKHGRLCTEPETA